VSQADIDVVLDQFAGVNERDFRRVMEHYAEDVVLVAPEGFLNRGTFEGKEAVGEWFGDWFRQFGNDYRFEIKETRALGGGLVYVFAEYSASGKASGAVVSDATAYLYRVKGDKVSRVQLFDTREEVLEAASSPEWSESETD
jgi:ketosteroid isomerase-like protein